MEPTKQDIVTQMAAAYLNNLKAREAEIAKMLKDIASEIELCTKAMEKDEPVNDLE